MGTWTERKAERREHYKRFVLGWRLVACSACSGSGYYDHSGSPRCGGCDGTGKVRIPPGVREAYEREVLNETKPRT